MEEEEEEKGTNFKISQFLPLVTRAKGSLSPFQPTNLLRNTTRKKNMCEWGEKAFRGVDIRTKKRNIRRDDVGRSVPTESCNVKKKRERREFCSNERIR